MGNHYYIFARCHDLNQNTATICSGNSRLAQRWEVVGQVEHVCIICSSKIKSLAKSKVTSPPPHPNFLAMKETKNSGKDKRKDPSGSGHSVDLNKISSKAEQNRFIAATTWRFLPREMTTIFAVDSQDKMKGF